MNKFFVITAMDDPGSEHDTWQEAADYARELQAEGAEPVILGPGCSPSPPSWAN